MRLGELSCCFIQGYVYHVTHYSYKLFCSGRTNIQQLNQATLSTLSSQGSISPVKRSASSGILSHSRHHKKKLPLHVLNIAAPVTRIRWKPADDTNDTTIAVATSSIYGANAGGNGNIGLWSVHRPFMPLSVCEGHVEGAVTDFVWTNQTTESKQIINNTDEEKKQSTRVSEWNVVLTVGRDGQCLLQDFTHGERPNLSVPSACVAMANLSPFQPGYGSLQLMSIQQAVDVGNSGPSDMSSKLVFHVTDQGDVGDLTRDSPVTVDISPELTHLSRFSELYVTSTGREFETKADVCRHNANVSNQLNQNSVRQMWKTLATILDGCGDLDGLPTTSQSSSTNPMVHMLTPTLHNLLLQRADAGDVQTCVVLCEVMDVIIPPTSAGGASKSRIPSLNISLVREWYLTYIDLLQQMCLFTQAASLIRNCNDPVINALNQQSTTINESCPKCGKPLLGGTTVQDDAGTSPQLSSQRLCRNCRDRIGLCFLCHEPVKGIFVWCAGCGHGGHLAHALEWFGENEVCPTGCGHKCNLFKNNS